VWYKESQTGYGYHGTDPVQFEQIRNSGIAKGSDFTDNEDDTSPYTDGVWLRFPFPSQFRRKIGMGNYYTTFEVIPPQSVEFKTDPWGDYRPL